MTEVYLNRFKCLSSFHDFCCQVKTFNKKIGSWLHLLELKQRKQYRKEYLDKT